jgi:hypothetical protein
VPYADKEKQRAYHRKYQQTEKRKAYKAAWYQANKERVSAYQVKYRDKFPDKNRRYFRNHHLVKTYGITLEQYEAIYKQQGGVCGICGNPPDIGRHGVARLAVDHDHATGKIRGLLCNNCNSGMGLIGDTAEHLVRALSYLKQHEGKE